MKYFIFSTLLLCSVVAYGQDLILTTAGDSLKCKIVEVNASEIQFRFGTGGIITIERKEVATYQYNYAPATTASPVSTAPARTAEQTYQTPASVSSQKTPHIYVGLVGGAPLLLVGLNGAYFFNRLIGAGFAVHHQVINYDDGSTDKITFYGPVFYGHWGRRNGKFFFPTNFGVGAVSYNYQYESYWNVFDATGTELGFFTSLGAAFKPTRSFSIGLNLEAAYSLGDDLLVGITLGINFHF